MFVCPFGSLAPLYILTSCKHSHAAPPVILLRIRFLWTYSRTCSSYPGDASLLSPSNFNLLTIWKTVSEEGCSSSGFSFLSYTFWMCDVRCFMRAFCSSFLLCLAFHVACHVARLMSVQQILSLISFSLSVPLTVATIKQKGEMCSAQNKICVVFFRVIPEVFKVIFISR